MQFQSKHQCHLELDCGITKLTWEHRRLQIAKTILIKTSGARSHCNTWFQGIAQSHSDKNSPITAWRQAHRPTNWEAELSHQYAWLCRQQIASTVSQYVTKASECSHCTKGRWFEEWNLANWTSGKVKPWHSLFTLYKNQPYVSQRACCKMETLKLLKGNRYEKLHQIGPPEVLKA